MANIIVLGGGMVGSAIAVDLSKQHQVTITDLRKQRLEVLSRQHSALETSVLDVTHADELKKAISPFDLVVCAVPGFLGFKTLRSIIEAGKDVVDISFFPEDPLSLDTLAKEKNVTAIVDCGVAPGMDNLILGRYNEVLKINSFECLVGGLPKVRKWPFFYKAPFSPVDVIEEYTRPARFVENGEIVVKEALTDRTLEYFDRVGTLESFNSDGLRTLLSTMSHIPFMIEKTLRYPGHAEAILMLRESGFFSNKKVEVDGQSITPLDFTSSILFNEWKLGEEEEELTLMRVTMKGMDANEEKVEVAYHLYDAFDQQTKTSSMARTTGYTATAAANLFLDGKFEEKGVFPPERVGKHEACFDYIIRYLEARGVHYQKTVKTLS